MKYVFFIASRWRNKDQALLLAKSIRRLGKRVYCFADPEHAHLDSQKDSEAEMKEFEAIKDWQNNPQVRKIFQRDMSRLRESSALILLLPAGKSAHLEAGMAYGMGKLCILIGEQKETESNYLIFKKWFPSIDKFIQSFG